MKNSYQKPEFNIISVSSSECFLSNSTDSEDVGETFTNNATTGVGNRPVEFW